jgi:hypothetical protein
MIIGKLLQMTPLQLLNYPFWQLKELAYDAWLVHVLAKLPPVIVLSLTSRELIHEHKVYCGTDARKAFYFSGGKLRWIYPKPTKWEELHLSSGSGGSARDCWYPACTRQLDVYPLQASRTRMGTWPNGKGAFPAPKEGAT